MDDFKNLPLGTRVHVVNIGEGLVIGLRIDRVITGTFPVETPDTDMDMAYVTFSEESEQGRQHKGDPVVAGTFYPHNITLLEPTR